MTRQWMIYGANGYSGELIAREAVRRGLKPILAGRSKHKIQPLADELALNFRAFPLDETVTEHLKDVALVLHCAGPFSATSAPMVQACLDAGSHYLDITGEINVFEACHARDQDARNAGIVICPGVGFDVIPTDCVAAALADAMPDTTELKLAFDSNSRLSPGTAKTSVEGIAEGGKVRKDGKITTVPLAYKVLDIDYGDGPKRSVTIPWGDVSTAYYSTGIPNIETYMSTPPAMIKQMKWMRLFRPLISLGFVQGMIKSRIEKTVKGPSEKARKALPTNVWGEVSNVKGEKRQARVTTANGYEVTVTGSLAITQYLLTNEVTGGAYTPSKLMGSALVEQLPGSSKITLS